MIFSGGKWRINGIDGYDGNLIIDEEKKGILLEIFIQTDTVISRFKKDDIQIICGSLSTGAHVTLLNCSVLKAIQGIGSSLMTQDILAEFAIFGIKDGCMDNLIFDHIEVKLDNAVQWSKLSEIKHNYINGNQSNIVWTTCDEVGIQIDKNTNLRLYPILERPNYKMIDEILLERYVVCEIISKIKVPLKLLLSYLNKVISLISFCMDDLVGYVNLKICVENNGLIDELEVFQSSYRYQKNKEKFRYSEDFISLKDLLIESELPLMTWFNKQDDLFEIVELFNLSNMHPEFPLEIHFLNIIKALEIFHYRFICKSKVEFLSRIEKVLDGCPQSVYDYHYAKLAKFPVKTKDLYLYNRLYDLFLANFEFNFDKSISSKIDIDYETLLVNTRNFYIHYDPNKRNRILSHEDLKYVIPTLRILLYYNIMKLVETNNDRIREVVGMKTRTLSNNMVVRSF